MNLGKGRAVFEQLESEKYTNEEKIEAIGLVANMETHNSVTKNMLLTALKWLFNHCCNNMWVKITTRPMTDEEEKELCEELGIEEGSLEDWEKRVFTCSLPDDGQEILISRGEYVQEDICSWDEYGCGLENNGDWDGVDAWMPKPEPYKKGGAE